MIRGTRRWSWAFAVAIVIGGCAAEPDHISLLDDLGRDGSTSGGSHEADARPEDSGETEGSIDTECTGDGECAAPLGYCNTGAGVCVECLGDANCLDGHCELSTHRCIEQCATETDCSEGHCDLTSGQCVQCATSADCLDLEAPLCNTTRGECVECLTNAECSTGLCLASRGECAACRVDADCEPNKWCDLTAYECRDLSSGAL